MFESDKITSLQGDCCEVFIGVPRAHTLSASCSAIGIKYVYRPVPSVLTRVSHVSTSASSTQLLDTNGDIIMSFSFVFIVDLAMVSQAMVRL